MLFTIKMVNGSINKALHAVSHKRWWHGSDAICIVKYRI